MREIARGSAKRVLAIGTMPADPALSPEQAVASDGLLIVMESNPARAEDARRRFLSAGLEGRATVIAGDPRRMVYKLAGPFDAIFCGDDIDSAVRDKVVALLAPDGVLITSAVAAISNPISRNIRATLDRIAALNPSLNAFTAVFESEAMAQAQRLDQELRQGRSRGPIHGLPVSIKDLIDVEGTATTAASRLRLGHVAPADAALVSRLREAGAVIIGKCNLHEFAFGTTSDESAFGPVRNPRDTSRSPGGSSGGSAAAVASALGWASIGSDTGGSIRIPAAACGVVGLKPTFGEIPTHGVVPLSVSLDHVGPLAASVRDVWTLFGILKGTGGRPETPAPAPHFRLGKLGGYFTQLLDADVRRAFNAAIERLKDAGASMRDVHIASATEVGKTYINIVLTEALAYHAKTLASDADKYSKGVRERLEMGRNIPADAYIEAQRMRGKLRAEVDAALMHCDALVLPTLPIPAPRIGADAIDIDGVEQPVRPTMLRLTQLFNLTGHPAVSLPCGETVDHLPCGLQLVGRREETIDLLRVALSCEPFVSPVGLL